MMFKAVLALATVMVAAGGFAIFDGTGMILNERGWTQVIGTTVIQVIGGSVVLSTGLLILSLAALLAHARTLFAAVGITTAGQADGSQAAHDVSEQGFAAHDHAVSDHAPRLADPVFAAPADHSQPAFGAETHQADNQHDVPPAPVSHDGHVAAPEPMAAFAETFERDYPASVSAYKPARHQDAAHEPSAHDLLADLVPPPVPMPVAQPDEWSQSVPPRQDNPPVQPSLLDNLTQPAPYHASYEPVRPTMPPAHTIERELVASYTAGGVGYFMYSDQTIEAEMAIGRYRFASMDELRHFVETNEGGVKVGESTQI